MSLPPGDTVFVVMIVIIMLVMLVFISYVLSHLGGWNDLAGEFSADRLPTGKTHYFRSGNLGAVSYGGCLILKVCDEGLGMSVLLPFRWFHPPLLIRWDQFHSTRRKRLFFLSITETYVGTPVIAHLSLPGLLCDRLLEEESKRSDKEVTESGDS